MDRLGVRALPALDAGVRLPMDEYSRDFSERRWLSDGHDSWKLERMQTFREPGSPSWEAFDSGDWDRALRLCEDQRPKLEPLIREAKQHRSYFHRVRVTETPVAAYLQWEFHYIRVRAQAGWERTRVVGAAEVTDLERHKPLPELVTLCGKTLYKVLYTGDGVAEGAIRFTEPEVVGAYEALIKDLYAIGEDLAPYFDREVAPLAPPQSQPPRT